MIDSFTYIGRAARVIFGSGKRTELSAEVEKPGASRTLIISASEQRGDAETVAEPLGDRAAGIHDKAIMHIPMETAHEARTVAKELNADCYVAVGGGMAIGREKGSALENEQPVIALPTTCADSEMTTIQGFAEGGVKSTQFGDRMLPKTVLYDPELTVTLPRSCRRPTAGRAA